MPRPWLLDPQFTIVESARGAATGYSFPSGHTQNAVGTYGGIARTSRRRAVRVACVAVILLVAFSRLYLGVHTPLDVGVSLALGAALVLLIWPLFVRAETDRRVLPALFGALLLFSVLFVLYVELGAAACKRDPGVPRERREERLYPAGRRRRAAAVYALDVARLRFDPRAPLIGQVAKCALGSASSWRCGR